MTQRPASTTTPQKAPARRAKSARCDRVRCPRVLRRARRRGRRGRDKARGQGRAARHRTPLQSTRYAGCGSGECPLVAKRASLRRAGRGRRYLDGKAPRRVDAAACVGCCDDRRPRHARIRSSEASSAREQSSRAREVLFPERPHQRCNRSRRHARARARFRPLALLRRQRDKRHVQLGAALAIAVGWSRLYLDEHWVDDVAGGWLLGVAVADAIAIIDGAVTAR